MSPERATINQKAQLGKEVTPGTAVVATRRLQAIGLDPSIDLDFAVFKPRGSKFPTLSTIGKDMSGAGISGQPAYNELPYLLSSILKIVAPTTPIGTVRQWLYEPANYAVDVPQTYTVEYGDGRGARFNHGVVTDLSLRATRDEVSMDGTMIGRETTDPFTLTAGLVDVAAIPMQPDDISIYIDNTSAGLGTTKMLRVLEAELSIGSRFGPVWVLDRAQASFATIVELEPTWELRLVMEADAQGMGPLADARAGTQKFVRFEAQGPLIETGHFHSLVVDLAAKVSGSGSYSDEDGVYAKEWTFGMMYDSTWAKALSIISKSNLNAL
jgi:hypothetical protein